MNARSFSLRAALLLLLLLAALPLAACASPTRLEGAALELELASGAVLDPKLEGSAPLSLALRLAEAPPGERCELELTATHRSGASRTEALGSFAAGEATEASWDGELAPGVPFDPGPVVLLVTARCEGGAVGSASVRAWILRLGLGEVDLVDHPEDRGQVPLAYHKRSFLERGVTVIGEEAPEYRLALEGGEALSDLDENDGRPREAIAPWARFDVPPWGEEGPAGSVHNLPAAYVAGTRARLRVTAGRRATSARLGVGVPAFGPPASEMSAEEAPPPIRLRATLADGLTELLPVDPEARVRPGESQAFDLLLPALMGREEVEIRWRYEAEVEGEWRPIPGEHRTLHRIYRLADLPALRDGGELGAGSGFAPAVPWIAALEELDPAISGLPPETRPLLDAIRDHLHYNRYVIYNPGDRAYSSYEGEYIFWEYSWSELSSWLDRDTGIELYCHSMSCLLSVLAGTVGVSAPQQVLGVGFSTNLTRAAGTEGWRTFSFNSHSFVSPDEGATFWDASVDLDGDDNPSAEPVTPLAPRGLPASEYLGRLVRSGDVSIVNTGHCFFR